MTGATAITAWRSRALDSLRLARESGQGQAEQRILADLRAVHEALGRGLVGTPEEQKDYLFARRTGSPVPELAAVSIDTNEWPLPPSAVPTASGLSRTSPETEQRITELFALTGPLAAGAADNPRYEARFRPEDGQRFQGTPLPWAIWDTQDNIPVAYHGDKELCEYQASIASDAYRSRKKPA
ncbi:hypothetical protein [Streptomyces sp. NPDC097619]|uniref:hypothetical protein n=1 Tax=Streptomyces sp. NPDC097619 TaxID=3157228 RepID=UPI0033181D01